MDAVKLKSRVFVIILGSLYTILNFNEMYYYTFTDWAKDVVFFNYTIQGEEYTIMKRSVKRSIYLQIFLFGMTAVYTMFKDKKMELMIFATGNIYRETGTASKKMLSISFKKRQEKTRSMDQSNQQSNNRKNEIQSSIDNPIMNISEQYDERVQNPLHNTNMSIKK